MSTARFFALSILVLGAALSRLMPHPWNMTPVAAIALFGGARFSKHWQAFLVPLVALALSDVFLGFYPEMIFVYPAFALIVCLGLALKKHPGLLSFSSLVCLSSLSFFVVTNFGVWALSGLYPHTGAGLLACYTAAIPFFRHSLVGDVVYAGFLFGGFALMERWQPVLQLKTAPSIVGSQ